MAGRVVRKVERKRVNGRLVENVKEETAGGILHWGRENDEDMRWFREEIRQGLRRAGATGAGSFRGRRRCTAGSTAAGL